MYRRLSFLLLLISIGLGACRQTPKHIAIQPFGGLSPDEIESVKKALEDTYHTQVTVLAESVLPAETFINVKSPRYRADKLIAHLKTTKPDSIDYILGLTEKDISTTKRDKWGHTKKPEHKYADWGIFGLGYTPGPSCVVSTFRLRNTSYSNYLLRLQKISIHEIGHNMGLPHCKTAHCVMADAAETIKTMTW